MEVFPLNHNSVKSCFCGENVKMGVGSHFYLYRVEVSELGKGGVIGWVTIYYLPQDFITDY